ncbi:MAG TPA: TPM domain-containing protein [Terriglobia bacterium]|nr:TPM domain-containing protein [Terriglobia bacterium]
MTRRQLLRNIDAARVKEAIARAENRTSGEIMVSVAPIFWGSVEKAAQKAFVRLGVDHTKEKNGVLIFVVPGRKKFVVLGDSGIHAKVGQDFWEDVAAQLSGHFRNGDFTGGLVRAIYVIGEKLGLHFPYDAATDVNGLPDDVDFGK